MPDIYVKNGATPTSPYNSWGTAADKVSVAAGIDTAGDTIYLSSSHSESSSTAQTVTLAGTPALPIKILSVTENTPPDTIAPGATVTTTGASNIAFTGSAYIYGVSFNVGVGGGAASFQLGGSVDTSTVVVENSSITLNANASSRILLGVASVGVESSYTFKNCTFKFQSTSQQINAAHNYLLIDNCTIDTSGSRLTTVLTAPSDAILYTICNSDLSWLASSATIMAGSGVTGTLTLINCELPSGWTGALTGTISKPGLRASMYNCDNAATNYRLRIEDYSGVITSDTGVYMAGGASDGVTNLSWKMVTNGNSNEFVAALRSDPIAVWVDTTGSKTITVNIAQNSSAAALKDSEIWLEVSALENASFPIGTVKTDRRATVLTPAVDQTTSTESWVGLDSPTKQKLEVSFTQGMKGFVYATVCLAKPSTTVYVDYEPTVT